MKMNHGMQQMEPGKMFVFSSISKENKFLKEKNQCYEKMLMDVKKSFPQILGMLKQKIRVSFIIDNMNELMTTIVQTEQMIKQQEQNFIQNQQHQMQMETNNNDLQMNNYQGNNAQVQYQQIEDYGDGVYTQQQYDNNMIQTQMVPQNQMQQYQNPMVYNQFNQGFNDQTIFSKPGMDVTMGSALYPNVIDLGCDDQ